LNALIPLANRFGGRKEGRWGNGRESGGWHHRHFDVGPPGLKNSLESGSGSGVLAVRSSRQTRLIWIFGQLPMMTRLTRPLHTLYKSPIGCVSRSHDSLDEVTSPDVGSSNIGMNPSSRSRTHQNQTQPGGSCPLSLALSPFGFAQWERGKDKDLSTESPVAVATGTGSVGPLGLKRGTETGGIKQV